MSSGFGFLREEYWRNSRANEETYFEAEYIEEPVVAPAAGEVVYLSRGPLIEANLTLTTEDGQTLTLGAHYLEASSPDGRAGFENRNVPEGTALTASYFVRVFEAGLPSPGGVPSEPVEEGRDLALLSGWTGGASCYLDRERVHFAGKLSGGAVVEGTPLFSLPSGLWSTRMASLATLSDEGPARVDVSPIGEARIGESPFVCGSGWLLLDGLSFRRGDPAFEDWGDEELRFGNEELDVSYGGLR